MKLSRQVLVLVALLAGLGGGFVRWVVFTDNDLAASSPTAGGDVATEPAANDAAEAQSTTTQSTTTTTLPRSAEVVFSGDILPHGAVVNQAAAYATDGWDFRPMFNLVRDELSSADLAICHLETALSVDNSRLSSYPIFNAPRTLADGILDAGYEGCSIASNHAYDRGPEGVAATLDVFDQVGLKHAGTARNQGEDDAITFYEVNGIKIAHLSATYGINGFVMPADQQYLIDLIDPEAILTEARAARSQGADFVILSLHWGAEYRSEPIQEQLDALNALLPDPDIDLIIGHHAHVVQPIDKVGDEWVVFGLGNFVSNQSVNCCAAASQDGMIAHITINETTPGVFKTESVDYTPTWVDRTNYTIVPVNEVLNGVIEYPVDPATLQASVARTAEVVASRLTTLDGLTQNS